MTALMCAAKEGYTEIVTVLITSHAFIEAKDEYEMMVDSKELKKLLLCTQLLMVIRILLMRCLKGVQILK